MASLQPMIAKCWRVGKAIFTFSRINTFLPEHHLPWLFLVMGLSCYSLGVHLLYGYLCLLLRTFWSRALYFHMRSPFPYSLIVTLRRSIYNMLRILRSFRLGNLCLPEFDDFLLNSLYVAKNEKQIGRNSIFWMLSTHLITQKWYIFGYSTSDLRPDGPTDALHIKGFWLCYILSVTPVSESTSEGKGDI